MSIWRLFNPVVSLDDESNDFDDDLGFTSARYIAEGMKDNLVNTSVSELQDGEKSGFLLCSR